MSKQDGEDVFSVDIDAVLEGVGEHDRVSGLCCIQDGMEISGFWRQEMISRIWKGGRKAERKKGRKEGNEERKKKRKKERKQEIEVGGK